MRQRIGLVCLVLMLAVSTARGDVPPPSDRGPPTGSAGSLNFAVKSISAQIQYGADKGQTITRQFVVLVGCVDGNPNCALAKSRNLIGMEVVTVDGQHLRFDTVQQIIDAFESKTAAPTVTLELISLTSQGEPIKVSFARH